MGKLAIVIPTVRGREEVFGRFMAAWTPLFNKHQANIVIVKDGEFPEVIYENQVYSAHTIMGEYEDCLTNYNGGIRNLGFAFVAKYLPETEYIVTLDDDTLPIGDTLQDHLDALNRRVPISWMSTASEYMRGFPYAVRDEAEVVLSHGVWEGVADWDAATQLVKGSYRPVEFYKGPIPKGIYFPMCAMNIAFKPCVLPYIFQAPWALGVNRFDDIWAGITTKRAADENGWAIVSGFARVRHDRASNTFTNLINEAPGLPLNETYWQGDESHPYFKVYKEKLDRWQAFLNQI